MGRAGELIETPTRFGKNCLLCGAHEPVSHTMVRNADGHGFAGRICGEHTLAEVTLRSLDRWMLDITWDGAGEFDEPGPPPEPNIHVVGQSYALCTVRKPDGDWCRGGHWTRDHGQATATKH